MPRPSKALAVEAQRKPAHAELVEARTNSGACLDKLGMSGSVLWRTGLAVSMFAVAATAQEANPPAAPALAAAPAPAKPAVPRVAQVTPVKERVLIVGALAKRTGQTQFLTLKPGQYIDFAGIRITARTCETTPPWEWPKLQGAFLQVDERLAGQVKRVFSGWLYAESPSLNVMQHPRYDVWLKSCTMRFPDGPSPRAPSSPAKKSPAAPTSAAPN